jgi:histidine triad (HIT) family protein
MPGIFARIVNGEIPCYKVAEDEEFLAFLDINPLAEGHVLVIPKTEIDYLFDIEDDLLGRMIIFSKKVARAIGMNVKCKKVGMAVLGLEVPHAHIHLVPVNTVYDIDFSKPKLSFTKEEFEIIAGKIRDSWSGERQ